MANTKLPARLLDTSAVPALNVTGDLTVDTTTLKVDSSNNKVLIGATSSSFNDILYLSGSGYGVSGWRVGSTATYVGKMHNNSGKLSLETDASRDIQFGSETNPDTIFIDTSDRRVGIGNANTTPVTTLDVKNSGDSAYTGGLLIRTGTSTTEATSLYHDNNSATTTVLANRYDNAGAAIKLILRASSGSPVTALTALGSGNVGIGETSPAAPLHVEHSSSTAYNGAAEITESLIVSNKNGTDDSGVNNVASIGLHVADGATSQGFINYVRTGNNTGKFSLSQRTGSSSYHEPLTINQNGYVTLNHDASEYGLELRSTGTRSGLVLATPNSGNTIKGSLLLLADNTLRLGTQSVYNIHMNQSGHNTMPNQPYIRCGGNTASMATNQGTTTDYSNWTDQVQTGITRSGAVFTVPTAGNYLITYSFYNWINNSGPGTTHAIYLKKGSTTVQETVAEYDFENDSYSYYDNQLQNSIVLNMAAGDTFKFTAYADIYGGTSHTNMSAYLLG